MQIIKPTEELSVDHPTIVIAGAPGICKTSLASTWRTLLLDFDRSAARAVNRADVVAIDSWANVAITRAALEPYAGVTIDTVERCLQRITDAMLEESPKHGANGILHPRSHAILRQRFVRFLDSIRDAGKDTLVVAHTREERDDKRTIRVEAPGQAYAELLKRADFVGYLTIVGHQRYLDFNPCERWIAKNPARWPALKVPPADQASGFVAELFERARAALKSKAAQSAGVATQVDVWRREIEQLETAPAFNTILPRVLALGATLQPQAKRLLWTRAQALGVRYDPQLRQFLPPAKGFVPPAPRTSEKSQTPRAAAWQPALLSALTTADGAR